MANFLSRLFSDKPVNPTVSLEQAAELLKTSPEALAAFESAYHTAMLEDEKADDNFFQTNSRQASAQARDGMSDAPSEENLQAAIAVGSRIVEELVAQTRVYVFDGDLSEPDRMDYFPSLPPTTAMVSNADINVLPKPLRPQLTGNLMKRDISEDSYPHVLYFYREAQNPAKNQKYRQYCYNMFRQGLDILDLDNVMYKIIGTNPNSMGYWLPSLVAACRGQDFFKIPATRIATVPLTLLQLTRSEYTELTQTTLNIVDQWASKVFQLDETKDYFIKTGTYSSKFDFRNAKVTGAKEVRELGEYLLFIHYQACQMASPLTTPCTYGVSTTTEWVVRDFIPDKENNPCIYKGLPLHTEYRVFVDADQKTVLGISPYWEPDTMKNRFKSGAADSMHHAHDYAVYKAHEETLMARYNASKDSVVEHIQSILPNLDLTGQWSVDIMQNGDEFYIIDMALAENSAFYECVPPELRRPSAENWIPQLTD